MTTAKIAEKYEVALPKTCKELNWQGETYFCWYKSENELEDNYTLCHTLDKYTKYEYFAEMVGRGDYIRIEGVKSEFIPAPQFHEILNVLPKKIDSYIIFFTENLIAYINGCDEILISCNVKNLNFTQAATELYLKIKSEDLL